MSATDDFQPGDIVWVGPVGDPLRKTTWRVLRIDRATEGVSYATLASGQTERTWVVPVSRLTRYRLMENA